MAGRAAVVIGINYETQIEGSGSRAGLTRLRYAEADARDVAAELTAAGYDVRLLLGAQATQRAIINAIVQQRRVAGADGLLVLHYSGHGDVDPDDEQMAYLLPVDTNPDELLASAIPLNVLAHNYLGAVGAALTLLDCCHSGWALGWKGAGDRGEPFRRQALATFNAATGRVVLTACPGEELARELRELGHGVFTHHLLEHWRERDAEVTAESLFAEIDQGLERRGLPRPVMGGTHRGRLTLREARAVAPTSPPPASVGLSTAEMERREQLYLAISQLSAEGWATVLDALGENPAALPGKNPLAQARTLVPKLANEGWLSVLMANVERQGAAEQAAAVAAQVADLTRQFEAARTRKDWDTAIRLGEQILGLDAQQASIRAPLALMHRERGVSYHAKGDYDRALDDFTRAIELAPQNAFCYNQRGVSYHNKGEHDRALADLTRAIELAPQQAEYYFERGKFYHNQNKYDRALADFTQAIELDPQNAQYYYSRGVSYHNKGEYNHAIADHTRAIALAPQQADYYFERGKSYLAKGDSDRVLADLTRAIALDPQREEYYRMRGMRYLMKGDNVRALADYTHANALAPQNGE